MEMRFMGKTGLLVSESCLGAMTFDRESTEETCRQMLDQFNEISDPGKPYPYEMIANNLR